MRTEINHKDPEAIREHTFDGIQEYDKRLPNWWLITLYGSILFSFAYWMYNEYPKTRQPDGPAIEKEMARIALAAQSTGAALTDEQIWTMSKDATIVAAGKETFLSNCASCHNPDLSGKIGPNLKDQIWIHGGLPTQVVHTITEGVAAKGMPTWGPILGKTKISEVASFIMSFHAPGEPIIDAAKAGAAPAAAK